MVIFQANIENIPGLYLFSRHLRNHGHNKSFLNIMTKSGDLKVPFSSICSE